MLWNLPFITVVLLTFIGIVTVLLKRNLLKILLGINILESAAPSELMVLPTPQALTLTSIVIGVATSALVLSFAMVLHKKYGTVDINEIRRLQG
jgi:multicomponent Na+:H+ antiporter subunit C